MLDGRTIFISVNVSTDNEADAAKAIDSLSRMILGLALEGLETQLEVSTENLTFEEVEQDEEL